MTDEELLKVYDDRSRSLQSKGCSRWLMHSASLRAVYERGRADGARMQRDMRPTEAMLNAAIEGQSFPQDFDADYQGKALRRAATVFLAMQRAAPLASEAETDGSEKV